MNELYTSIYTRFVKPGLLCTDELLTKTQHQPIISLHKIMNRITYIFTFKIEKACLVYELSTLENKS